MSDEKEKATTIEDNLPSDISAEQAVLGACFVTNCPEAIHKARRILQPSDFYRAENRLLFTSLCHLADKGVQIDIVTALDQLKADHAKIKDAIGFVTMLANSEPTAALIEDHARIVKSASDRRAALNVSRVLTADAMDPSKDIAATRAAALNALVTGGNGDNEIKPAADLVTSFMQRIEQAPEPCYSTGLTELDKLLDGGLYSGLYAIGAISSLGKTTFALQIADRIASTGKDILYFSLEMSSDELMAKSLSRLTYAADKTSKHIHAKSARQILKGAVDGQKGDKDVFLDAVQQYLEGTGQHIHFIANDKISVKDIRAAVLAHKVKTGNVPLIFIDYLQLLDPVDPRASDKQNMDYCVKGLKAISRDFKTSIVAISSFNRDNYNSPANMAALKESGAIEYSCDAVLALQYQYMESRGETDAARKKRIADDRKRADEDVKKASRCRLTR